MSQQPTVAPGTAAPPKAEEVDVTKNPVNNGVERCSAPHIQRCDCLAVAFQGAAIPDPRLFQMFNCEICGQTMPPRTPAQRVVLAYRDRTYPTVPLMFEPDSKKWLKAKARSRRLRRHRLTDEEKTDWKWLPDPGGHGLEIVREVNVCPACAEKRRQAERVRLPEVPKATPDSNSSRVASSRARA